MLYAQKKMGWNLDWQKIKQYLENRWDVLEIRYYTGVKEGDEKMQKFLRYLHYIGFAPITKPLKIIKIDERHPLYKVYQYPEIHKSNFDVEIAADVLLDHGDAKQIIFFSGDSDFVYLIKKLRSIGRGSVIFSSKKMLAWELKFVASEIIVFENIKDYIVKVAPDKNAEQKL